MLEKKDIEVQVELIKSTAESLIISNSEELKNATEFIKEVKDKQKVVKTFYEPMVKIAKKSYDDIKAERDKLLKPLEQTESDIRSLMNDYNNKILAIQKAEEEARKKAEEEQMKKLQEVQDAIKDGNTQFAKEKMEEALSTTLPETRTEKPQISGMSTRTTYVVNVIDIEKVPAKLGGVPLVELSKIGKDYLIKEYKIRKALGQNFDVEGIEIREEVTTVIR